MKRHVLIFGAVGGLLIAVLQYSEYRLLVVQHSETIYTALVAVLFAIFGIWLGQRITRLPASVPAAAPCPEQPAAAAASFAPDRARQQVLGITARELEVLTLVARGLSNRAIAGELFVAESTVKTHCARAFDKLGARRRIEAVRRGQELGLLP